MITEITQVTPTRAYDLLEPQERDAVDDYITYIVGEQRRKRERIALALNYPIPTEYIKRSKNALYKPIVRAALTERIKEEAETQDLGVERVIKEFTSLALSNINDFIEPTSFGDFRIKDLDTIDPMLLGAVKSIETKPGAFGLHSKIILHDKIPALNALAEMMGITRQSNDKTPVLHDYVKPLEAVKKEAKLQGDEGYVKLLERLEHGEQQ